MATRASATAAATCPRQPYTVSLGSQQSPDVETPAAVCTNAEPTQNSSPWFRWLPYARLVGRRQAVSNSFIGLFVEGLSHSISAMLRRTREANEEPWLMQPGLLPGNPHGASALGVSTSILWTILIGFIAGVLCQAHHPWKQ